MPSCGGPGQYNFELTIDVANPGDRSEPVNASGSLPKPALSIVPPEVGGLRLFVNGSIPVSEVLTNPAYLAEFQSVSIPSFVEDGQKLELLATGADGEPIQPPLALRTHTLRFVDGGGTSIDSEADGELTLATSVRGASTTARVLPSPALVAAISGGSLALVELGDGVGSGGSGAGCRLAGIRVGPWGHGLLMLSPLGYVLLLKRWSRSR